MIFSRVFEFFLYISIKSMLAYSYIMLKYYLCWWCFNISPQAVYYHTVVKTMFRISGWFFVALFFSVYCLQKQTWYSRLYKEVTNSPITLLYGKGVSFVHCAGLCTGDDYCIEFLYSETSSLCIGHHYVKKGCYSYQYVLPASPRLLYFKKGKL